MSLISAGFLSPSSICSVESSWEVPWASAASSITGLISWHLVRFSDLILNKILVCPEWSSSCSEIGYHNYPESNNSGIIPQQGLGALVRTFLSIFYFFTLTSVSYILFAVPAWWWDAELPRVRNLVPRPSYVSHFLAWGLTPSTLGGTRPGSGCLQDLPSSTACCLHCTWDLHGHGMAWVRV